MRKSTIAILVLLLVVGAGTLFLADAYLGPAKEDMGVGQRLTRQFGDRGDVVSGSRVRVLRVARAEGREGAGLNLELTPAPAVLSRAGALRALVRSVARAAGEAYGTAGTSLRWYRVRVFLPGEERREVLLWRDTDDQVGEPEPALPTVWPPEGAPQPPPEPKQPPQGQGAPPPRRPTRRGRRPPHPPDPRNPAADVRAPRVACRAGVSGYLRGFAPRGARR